MAVSYHLWVKPDGEAHRRFASLIVRLAQEMNAPVFEPHMTLLGNLGGEEEELVGRTTQLAAALKPFEVALGTPDCRDTYFQCVFLHAADTPLLLDAHRLARRLFDHAPLASYMPHLSLLYGLYPVERKRMVIARLPGDLPQSIHVEAVSLIRTDSDDPKDWHEMSAAKLGAAPEEPRVRR
jgi:2'-5' RNA ligase